MKPVAMGLGGILLLLAAAAQAVDSLSVEAGNNFFNNPRTNFVRVGAQWDWDQKWLTDRSWVLGGYWDVSVARWHSNDVDGSHDVVDVGFAPGLRYQKSGPAAFIPYVEASLGIHYLTNTSITRYRHFSTNYQFGPQLGAGFRFGGKGEYDLAYSLQHISNADIKKPNPGIDFQQIRFRYHF